MPATLHFLVDGDDDIHDEARLLNLLTETGDPLQNDFGDGDVDVDVDAGVGAAAGEHALLVAALNIELDLNGENPTSLFLWW